MRISIPFTAAALAAVSVMSLAPVVGADNGPPGDIPDNQAFVAYHGAGYLLKVPEGWGRTGSGRSVRFADKYNSIHVDVSSALRRPSLASVRRVELPALRAKTKGFASPHLSTVRRPAGAAILITYHALSAPNPVTGKSIRTDVNRYEFWRRGRSYTITLQAPAGSDNVDPYRLITSSLRWR
ncbi:MAG TPA: hypothetical protein VLK36_06795 [Gaiellaceae bacterium]|nr:hypothetical protein [Gaiellaceae bacterium]